MYDDHVGVKLIIGDLKARGDSGILGKKPECSISGIERTTFRASSDPVREVF